MKTKIKLKSGYAKGGEVRKMNLSEAVIYNGSTHYISEKDGLVGLTNMSQGAWGSDYPFTPIYSISLKNEVRDMYGNKVDIPIRVENFAKGGKLYYQQDGIGQSKYTVSFYDGKKTHKDGSPFYDIAIFKNKKDLKSYIEKLESEGYKTR